MSAWRSVALPLKRRALPRPGIVEIWLTELAELPLALGPDGSSRKQQLLRRRVHQQFILRLLLGSYLGLPGKAVTLVRSDRGKPALAPELAASGLFFNLSHSGDWLAIAISRDTPVGIDIENRRALRRPLELARRFFPRAEAEWLAGLETSELSAAFFEQWTAREALVKATGTSLAESLSGLALGWSPCRIHGLPPGWPGADQWSLLRPQMPDGLIGHLAAPRADLACEAFFLQSG